MHVGGGECAVYHLGAVDAVARNTPVNQAAQNGLQSRATGAQVNRRNDAAAWIEPSETTAKRADGVGRVIENFGQDNAIKAPRASEALFAGHNNRFNAKAGVTLRRSRGVALKSEVCAGIAASAQATEQHAVSTSNIEDRFAVPYGVADCPVAGRLVVVLKSAPMGVSRDGAHGSRLLWVILRCGKESAEEPANHEVSAEYGSNGQEGDYQPFVKRRQVNWGIHKGPQASTNRNQSARNFAS